jgi:tRNA-dihydrouridine synthase
VIDCSSGGIAGSATAAQVPRGLGFQVPYAERVRNDVGIASMVVGIILEAQQAEAILQNGQADLIAVGRQSQFNPNIAQHWAHNLGINRKFEDWTPEFGWWLEKRIRTIEGVRHTDRGRHATQDANSRGVKPTRCERRAFSDFGARGPLCPDEPTR